MIYLITEFFNIRVFHIIEMNLTYSRTPLRPALLLSLFLTIWAALPFAAKGQTCRVSVGSNADGTHAYKEVFEYDCVDQKPQFPGGREALMKFINDNRQYPRDAYERGIEGRVTCSFVVNADGNISNLKVIKGSHSSLNIEAMRILAEMPNWEPGKKGDKHVPVRVVHCIPFRK